MVVVHQAASVCFLSLFLASQVDMDLRTWAAGTRVPHFPEVVLFVSFQNPAWIYMFFPQVVGLLIEFQSVVCRAFENSNIQTVFLQFIFAGEQLPCPVYRFFLEIIAKRPIAQHLEHGVVVGVVAHFLQVVVLARHTQALLCIGYPWKSHFAIAQKQILKRIHPCVGKHQSRIVLDHHGRARHNLVLLALEKIQKLLPYFLRCHHNVNVEVICL